MKRIFFIAAAALLACACHEIPQDAHKPFAPRWERELYVAGPVADNEAEFEKALAARTRTQNEYNRMGGYKAP